MYITPTFRQYLSSVDTDNLVSFKTLNWKFVLESNYSSSSFSSSSLKSLGPLDAFKGYTIRSKYVTLGLHLSPWFKPLLRNP
jgi:hypothetical protein